MPLPKDFSKTINALTARGLGLEKNKADFASAADQQIVKPFLTQAAKIADIDAKQELAKAALHQITEELNSAIKEMTEVESQLTSLIYAKYTKKNDKLEEFGLKSWKTGGKKGPRAKKACSS
ncbi:hypothetical protein HY768_07240 [candidate division TA06 bacterium]|uniref:Uncharacterized protein n=1 Tax=candidate division TA06 bacterium TaxID=2250710 RepID=A0A933IBP4_UNCT6|nr:hypothetical protein [candidate division TA06 bacterium]